MKSFFLLLLFLSFNITYSKEAIVIVLQAPLLKAPELDSHVLQYVRKGNKIYIPDHLVKTFPLPEFIETFDRAGNTAYVPTKYIKLITNDDREKLQKINYGEHDPTDYRIEEPIPSSYPFNNYSYLKTSFALTIGNNVKSPYGYEQDVSYQKFSPETGARVLLTRRVSFDQYDRFYFGLILAISSTTNKFSFQNGDASRENRSILRAGPYISFDTFKSDRFRITLGTGFTYNYHRASIDYDLSDGSSEQRLYSAYSLSPIASCYLQVENVLPSTDLLLGTDLNFYLNRDLKTKDSATFDVWPSDTIKEEMKVQSNLYLGVQIKY